jgi:hypothetical protein
MSPSTSGSQGHGGPTLTTEQFQFHLEEYKSLRQEIDTRIKEIFTIVVYCVTAISAVYGTILAGVLTGHVVPSDRPLLSNVLLVTCIFPVFGWFKSFELSSMIWTIAEYLRSIERKIGVVGWEQRIQHRRESRRRGLFSCLWESLISPPYHAFWVMALGIAIFIATDYPHLLPRCIVKVCMSINPTLPE